MASVTYEHVTKRYRDTTAVHDLNITVEDGEFLVFVGPSGCGKTTSLRMLAGLEEVSAGSIYIGDRRVNDVPPKDRDIAMVFQSYALYPHMTVAENMAFGLKLRGLPTGGDRKPGQGGGQAPWDRAPAQPQAQGTFGWATAAGCRRAGHCAQPGGVFDG
jgi:ABC-type sugar transport system ATPase subunit